MDRKLKNIIVILGVVALILTVATIYQYIRATDYKTQIANSYQRTFTELVDYVDNVDNTLTKALLVRTPGQLATVSSELWRKSAFAQACIGQLPTSALNLETTSKFLSQVGDYAYVLSKKVVDGGTISDEEYETMKTLAGYAVKLNASLQEMETKLYSGELKFNTATKESKDFYGTQETAVSDGLTAAEEEFADYPSLIYDGPFSDHLENPEIRMLKGKEEISKQEAKQMAINFFGKENVVAAEVTAEYGDKIKFYTVNVTKKGDSSSINVSITKKGGYVLQMVDDRIPSRSDLSIKDAVKKAKAFLISQNIIEMKDTYYQLNTNSVIINFAYEQDGGIVVYPDLIKVEVALDNGEIIGYEASGFLQNHVMRDVPASVVPLNQVLSNINQDMQVEKTGLAIIPLDTGVEAYCYEIKGKFMGKDMLLYVDAATGEEKNVLILLKTPGGTLTI